MLKKRKVIINSGTGLFPLAWIASGIYKKNKLIKLVIAGYPTERIIRTLFRFEFIKNIFKRLLGRKIEINDRNQTRLVCF